MAKIKKFIRKTKNAFNDNKSLIIAGIIVFMFAIMFLLLGVCFTISTEIGSLFISLSASMITIIITIYLVDRIIKSGEKRRLSNEEKLRKQQQWEFEFENDKQMLNRYVAGIQAIIKIMRETMDNFNNHVIQENKSLMLDYLRIQLRLELENVPLTYSFNPNDGDLVSENMKSIQDNMELINEFSRYINNEEIVRGKLISYESMLYHSRFEILKMKPSKNNK